MRRDTFRVDNGAGASLALTCTSDPAVLVSARRPVLIIPGYAMNSFVFGYHPRGLSLVGYLVSRGFEVWTADLRAQGQSTGGRRRFGLAEVGLEDLPAVFKGVLAHTQSQAEGLDALGCSLGASYLMMQLAWNPQHPIKRFVNLGGPLRWEAIHPLLACAARLGPLWSIPMRGTRRLARAALPLLARFPSLLHIYLHPEHVDLSAPELLAQTIEDPVPGVNRDLARWIRRGDFVHEGRNLTDSITGCRLPLLTVVAVADGVVPEATVCSAHHRFAGPKHIIYAGNQEHPMAHADLFISDAAESQVFEPLAHWLLTNADG